MAEQFKNLASTTLDGAINDTVETITVASAMGFTSGSFRILVDSEIMKVTAVSGLNLTVARGQEGTSPTAHDNGATVRHVLTAGALNAHDQDDLAVRDTYANKPAASVPGRIFLPTDGVFIERDNGAAWEKFGPIWPMTPPQASDFPTWANQGTSSCVDNGGAVYLLGPYSTSLSMSACVKAYPSTPFTVEMAFLPNWLAYNSSSQVACGLCIRDSVSSKMQAYGIGGSSTDIYIQGYNYASPTSNYGSITGWPSGKHYAETPLVWLKFSDDGTNRVISVSVNGYTWSQLVSLSSTDYLTPDQIGLIVNRYQSYTSSSPYLNIDMGMTVLHWRQY